MPTTRISTATSGSSQFRRRKGSRTRAKPRARKVIGIPHPSAGNHNGGTVAFGPDGKMYLATGDGGGACDDPRTPRTRARCWASCCGSSPNRSGGYSNPGDNPFVGSATRGEIYALGLRNPFRFSFDEATRTIVIGDVGQSAWEEVDYGTLHGVRGANFGWNAFEGSERGTCGSFSSPPPKDHQGPIHQYGHSGAGHTGCAITGGVVVRNRKLRKLDGRYVFADYCTGQLRSLVPELGGAERERAAGLRIPHPTSFSNGRHGRLYVTSQDGAVFEIKQAPTSRARAGEEPRRRAGDGRGGFEADRIAHFKMPVYVHGPKGANGLIFVVEQRGVIRMIKDGRKLGGKFLDIRGRVGHGHERGLLSVAFSPSYRKNRRFYVFYTDSGGDLRIEEYKRSRSNPRKARAGSARRCSRSSTAPTTTTTAASCSSAPTASCTYRPVTGAAPPTRASTRRTRRACSARSCGSIRAEAGASATRCPPATRSWAAGDARRSTRSASAIRSASPSTAIAGGS